MRRSGFCRQRAVCQLLGVGAVLALASLLPLHAQQTHGSAAVIPQDQLIQPEQLHRDLENGAGKILVLQVGSRTLFDEAHIPGAEYAGPGSRPDGLEALRSRVASLPHTQAIVIYCGCCPWDRCPNIGPAWQLLHGMGFTHVRALYIADNFGANWINKGYRVASH